MGTTVKEWCRLLVITSSISKSGRFPDEVNNIDQEFIRCNYWYRNYDFSSRETLNRHYFDIFWKFIRKFGSKILQRSGQLLLQHPEMISLTSGYILLINNKSVFALNKPEKLSIFLL